MTGPAGNSRRWRLGACLSLTGKYARFGSQAAHALRAWHALDGGAEILVEDDGSDPARVASILRALAGRCEVLLGPYSTQLMRAASRVAPDLDQLLWNHGGSGDDVQAAAPGHVVSVLAPTSRYAEPFLRHLAVHTEPAPLVLVEGRGSFGRQVITGAEAITRTLGLSTRRAGPTDDLPAEHRGVWDLFCAGSFEEDVATVTAARALPHPPRLIGTVAAGVREFGRQVTQAQGVHGIAQWFPHRHLSVAVGPAEATFLRVYTQLAGAVPDYPGVQVAATAALAAHCVRAAGSARRESLWGLAASLSTTTMFGDFAINPVTGAQLAHEPVLVRWTADGMQAVAPGNGSFGLPGNSL